jgi:hypothetical protein
VLTAAASARSSWFHRRRPRAARHCAGSIMLTRMPVDDGERKFLSENVLKRIISLSDADRVAPDTAGSAPGFRVSQTAGACGGRTCRTIWRTFAASFNNGL